MKPSGLSPSHSGDPRPRDPQAYPTHRPRPAGATQRQITWESPSGTLAPSHALLVEPRDPLARPHSPLRPAGLRTTQSPSQRPAPQPTQPNAVPTHRPDGGLAYVTYTINPVAEEK